MSSAASRIASLASHLLSPSANPPSTAPHIHTLSPTLFLPRAAAIEPSKEAIVHITTNGAVLRRSYQEFADRARGLAYYLRRHGFRRVGVLAPNTPAFLEAIYGVPAAGAVIVPVNYRLKSEDVAYIFEFAEVDCVVVDEEFVGLLGEYRRRCPGVPLLVDTDTDATEGQLCGPYDEAVLEGLTWDREHGSQGWEGLHVQTQDEDSTIALPFTSGTTSRPKGVIFTHRGSYLAAMANLIEVGLNNPGSRYLWTLPMFHAMGWTYPWSIVAVRATSVCLRKIDYPLIWKLLKEERITHFAAAPTVNTLLVASKEAEKLEQAVQVAVAASPPSGHLFEQMAELNLIPTHLYGMTETYGPLTKCYPMPEWNSLPPHERYAKMARQGHAFITSMPIRVVKPDQPDGKLVDVAKDGKEVGEIVFFGNLCTKGYYKDPEATRKAFAGGGLHSGDLAVWHEDGSAQIVDRAKDIIISGGENISSVALESMLAENPDILEVGVVGVPDSHWGERPKAYVTAQEGRSPRPEDVIAWARGRSSISKFMVPREVEVVDELPKTSTGKIKKNVLREWARHGRKA